MRRLIFWIGIWGVVALAKEDLPSEGKKNRQNVELKKKHSFEDFLIQGRFQYTEHFVISVEEDKSLKSLADMPSDFTQRILEDH